MHLALFVDDQQTAINAFDARFRTLRLGPEWTCETLLTPADSSSGRIVESIENILDRYPGQSCTVFIDVMLQGLITLGIDVARVLRRRRPTIPIIAVSQHQEDARVFIESVTERAVACYVHKSLLFGLDPSEFCDLVDAAAARAHDAASMSRNLGSEPAAAASTAVDWALLTAKTDEHNALLEALKSAGADGQANGDADPVEWMFLNQRIRVDCAGEQGLVWAASQVTEVIDRYRPKRVLALGICGFRPKPDRSVFDVYIPKLAMHYMFGKLENEGICARTNNQRPLAVDAVRFAALEKVCRPVLAAWLALERIQIPSPRWHNEPMGSADVLNVDVKTTDLLLRPSGEDVAGIDMEAFAVAFAGAKYEVPCMVVKVASDSLAQRDGEKSDACRIAAAAALLVVQWVSNPGVPPTLAGKGR